MTRANNTLFTNKYKEMSPVAKEEGLKILNEWAEEAAREGYGGDGVIYNDIREHLETKLNEDAIVDACYNLNNFDKVEVYYSLTKHQKGINGNKHVGGVLYTIEITRKDELEFHQAYYINLLPNHHRILIDTFQPYLCMRGTTREEMLGKGQSVVSGMVTKIDTYLDMLEKSTNVGVDNPDALLKTAHISQSSRDGIIKIYNASENKKLYDLVNACSEYANTLSYEEGLKYRYVAGLMLQRGLK